jgi:hypothetical protein
MKYGMMTWRTFHNMYAKLFMQIYASYADIVLKKYVKKIIF